jgi:hypothetical protein
VGLKHAERWIKQRRAVMQVDGRIRLSEQHRQAMARSLRRGAAAIHGADYDAVRRRMSPAEQRRIPITQPPDRITRRAIGERGPQTRRLVAAHAVMDRPVEFVGHITRGAEGVA